MLVVEPLEDAGVAGRDARDDERRHRLSSRALGHTQDSLSSYYLVGLAQAAATDAARVGVVVRYLRDIDRDEAAEPLQGGLPHLTTIEVTPEGVGPQGLRLDQASRAKLAAEGVDPDVVERELHGMNPGDRKLLADVVYGAKGGVPRAEVDEQLRWFGIAPTPEEEQRIARGETVTFLIAE